MFASRRGQRCKRLFVGGFCPSRDTRDDVYAATVFKTFRDPQLLTGKLRGHYPVTHLTRSNYRACFARLSQVRNSHATRRSDAERRDSTLNFRVVQVTFASRTTSTVCRSYSLAFFVYES